MRYLLLVFTLLLLPVTAQAKQLSVQKADVSQLKIVTPNEGTSSPQRNAWGIDSNYVGPGDIRKIERIDIYLDTYQRVSSVKVTRTTYTNDVATLLFLQVEELSIQTVPKGSKRISQPILIAIHTGDSLTFP